MVWEHGEAYAEQIGWDASFEAMVAGVVGDYAQAPRRGPPWIAEADPPPPPCAHRCRSTPASPNSASAGPGPRGLGAGTDRSGPNALAFARAAATTA